jgi:hypothetical protein
VPLFNRFDEFFEQHVKPRKDLRLSQSADASSTENQQDPPFPVDACLQVLRVTSVLLENCSSKHLYASYEVRASFMPPFWAAWDRLGAEPSTLRDLAVYMTWQHGATRGCCVMVNASSSSLMHAR